ncbi:hypothetical protein [Streptomyces sp. NPDC059009]|uniref:hypothetical protein n=1 Tax=Streptomyces sp. NPDC059009 TaxID=3346694 RepID=UPI00369AE486
MTVALMWEARAAEGRGAELLAWAKDQGLVTKDQGRAEGRESAAAPVPLRRETFRAPEDRVLVITWWDADLDAELPELPEPAGELLTRSVHRWRFESLGADAG